MTAYACFVQASREEHTKKHPDEKLVFTEFSKKCAAKWKVLNAKDRKKFDDMAAKDKIRYDREMANYVPSGDAKGKRKNKKDPNAPKRPLSAFFFFCNDERPKVKAIHPEWTVGDIAKELGKRWEVCPNKGKYEDMNAKAKIKYQKDLEQYKKTGVCSSPKKSPKKARRQVEEEEEEEDEDDDDEDDDDEEEDD